MALDIRDEIEAAERSYQTQEVTQPFAWVMGAETLRRVRAAAHAGMPVMDSLGPTRLHGLPIISIFGGAGLLLASRSLADAMLRFGKVVE